MTSWCTWCRFSFLDDTSRSDRSESVMSGPDMPSISPMPGSSERNSGQSSIISNEIQEKCPNKLVTTVWNQVKGLQMSLILVECDLMSGSGKLKFVEAWLHWNLSFRAVTSLSIWQCCSSTIFLWCLRESHAYQAGLEALIQRMHCFNALYSCNLQRNLTSIRL